MITFIFVLLSIITILIMYILFDKKSVKTKKSTTRNNTSKDYDSEIIKYTDLEKLLKIKSINNNIITTLNNEISCVIKISTPDYNIMSESDQTIYENRLIELMYKLNHDIKVITIVRNAETETIVTNIQQSRKNLDNNQNLINYSNNLEQALKGEKSTKVFQKYYCIFSREKYSEEKINDLKHKSASFIKSVENTGSSAKILNTGELIELLSVILKKYEAINIKLFKKRMSKMSK